RPANSRLHLRADERDPGPQSPRSRLRGAPIHRRARPSLLEHPVASGRRAGSAKVSPGKLDRILLVSTGGESNEAALRMAKLVTGKHEIVAMSRSWHGVTGGAASATYSSSRRGYGPSMPGALVLPAPDNYRSRFIDERGVYDWKSELEFGFELV